jgi:hypothetical protein
MKSLSAAAFFSLVCLWQEGWGQGLFDRPGEPVAAADSLQQRWQGKFDSLRALGRVQHLGDSLNVTGWADSLQHRVKSQIGNREQQLRSTLDSLRGHKRKARVVQRKLDSLELKQKQLLSEIDSQRMVLQKRLTARYSKWQSKLDSAGLKVLSLNLPGVPSTGGVSVPNADVAGQMNLPELPALNTNDFTNLNLSPDLQQLGGDLAIPSTTSLSQWTDQLKQTGALPEITGKAGEVKAALSDPAKAAEQAVTQLDAVQAATKEMTDGQKLMQENQALELAEKMNDPDALKQEAVEQIQQQAVDHFAGKQEVLQQAMDKMSKYKRKFSSLESLDKLPKHPNRPRNGLKGQPFRERFRVGLNAGIANTSDTLNVDFFPNASYHITGRLEAGLGLMYRVRLEKDPWQFHQQQPQWGVNAFATFKALKGVRWRLETDANSIPQPGKVGAEGNMVREWKWTWLTGVQTTFNISRQFTGNVQMLYNFDRQLSDGFPEFLVLRVGLQYKLKHVKNTAN